MVHKPAITHVTIDELIEHRWSPRAFNPNRPVSRQHLLALLEAARWAPSCYGDEPWRLIVCDKYHNVMAWEKALNCSAEANQLWARNAPLLILVTTRQHFRHNGQPNRWAEYDTGAASENLCLEAVSLGLSAHQMGGFDANKACEVFAIPEGVTCMTIIAVGYQTSPDILPDDLKEREIAERTRTPFNEHFFEGTWGTPVAEER